LEEFSKKGDPETTLNNSGIIRCHDRAAVPPYQVIPILASPDFGAFGFEIWHCS